MYLSELSELLGAKLKGENVFFTDVSIDSRTITPGQLFIAIKGDTFDGHHFLLKAKERQASAAIVEKYIDCDLPQVLVTNTIEALRNLARFKRNQFDIPIIGLTGSCGKTTTKAMLAAILSQTYKVLAPKNSMNNHIGLPLTLLQLTSEHDYAVLEMGTNHFGEISYLSQTAEPNIALVTNIGPAHLETFGDLEGVARAKGEIFDGLAEDGIAILNANDPYSKYLQSLLDDKRCYFFGDDTNSLTYVSQVQVNSNQVTFNLHVKDKVTTVNLPLLGKHNVSNALAAATCACVLGFDITTIKNGLESVKPVDKRLLIHKGLCGATVIDDSYSAIPNAVEAALEVLANSKSNKIFVFGGMAELNKKEAIYLHQKIGILAKNLGITKVFAVGKLSEETVKSFGDGGQYFPDKKTLINALKKNLDEHTTVLIKGSRGMKMEEIVAAITQ